LDANNEYFGIIITLRDNGGELVPLTLGFEPAVKLAIEENGIKVMRKAKSFEVVKYQVDEILLKFGLLDGFKNNLLPITTDAALVGAFEKNHLALSCNSHNLSNHMLRLVNTEANRYVKSCKFDEEIKNIKYVINDASHVKTRYDPNCPTCQIKPDPKCQKCVTCYKSLNLYLGTKE